MAEGFDMGRQQKADPASLDGAASRTDVAASLLGTPLPATPIHKISFPAAEQAGNRVFLKRDDLLPFSFGGNKVRIARAFVADMIEQGCDALVMYGDLQSNLCRVLANLCHELGVPALMVATAHDQEAHDQAAHGGSDRANANSTAEAPASFNERLVRRFGIDVLRCASDGIADAVDEAMDRLRSQGRRPYYIYGNRYGTGNEGTAARAYEEAYREICVQERKLGLSFGIIATPYGTGCTQGGLICGSLNAADGRSIVGFSISSRSPERARSVLEETVADWHRKSGRTLPEGWRDHIDLQCGYNRGGYGTEDVRVDEMVEFMLKENSVPTDPTYMGKALLGLADYLLEHDVRDTDILFLHTGGLPLFFDYLERARALH